MMDVKLDGRETWPVLHGWFDYRYVKLNEDDKRE
jgi:hypothetical protein